MPYSVVPIAHVPTSAAEHPASSLWDRRLNGPLGIGAFGLYQVDLPAGAETVPHDHRHEGVEDAYVVVRGSGWLVVDGDDVPLAEGSAASVTPEATRSIRAGASGCVFIAVCA
jgi:quercetin dioxygenase-like cupin family protein